MVGLAVMLVWWPPAGVFAAEGSGLARGPVIDSSVLENQSVVVKSYYATIRSKPNDDAELIGYVPGALTLLVAQPQREVDGWLQVGVPFWWSTSDEMWVRRKDVVFASEFRRMEGQRWSLRYSVLYLLQGSPGLTSLTYYPVDNRCPEKLSAASTATLLKDAGVKKRSSVSVGCSEIWYVPNTKLIFGGGSAGWYDPTTGDIFFSKDSVANHAVYGYRGGRVLEFTPEACANGEEIACGTAHRDPLKTIPPHPPANPYRAHPAARPHPPGSYRASPDARPHPPSH